MVNQFGGATLKYASHNLETPSGADYDSEGNETHSQILKRWNSIVGCNHVEITSQTEAVSISMPASPNPRKVGKTKPIEMKHKNKAEAGRRISKADGYSTFKTRSVQFERQIPNLRRMPWSKTEAKNSEVEEEAEALPAAERYFDALEGPELESLKASEKLLLPEDEKWPFLLRVPISTFGIALGLSIQALLWKTMATSPAMRFLHVKLAANYVVWCFAIAAMILVASVYLLKTAVFFEAVRREFSHPVRVNFFFAPWIGCILLVVSSPPPVARHLQHEAVWYVLMTPVLILHLKIYGEWMMGGERTLSKVANPLNHLPLAGNFSVALLGSFVGLKEWPVFFFSVGLAHYVVLFVTLYQRLPTNQTLPKELHPVFFLFIAVPSLACLSWTMIAGTFDLVSRIAYFLAMFLYASLVLPCLVGLHSSYEQCFNCHHHIYCSCYQSLHKDPLCGTLFYFDSHRPIAVGLHRHPRFRIPHPLPQRHRHCHHGEEVTIEEEEEEEEYLK
ncbi:S-type anion channel SLAH2 [Apostasia shenzhenica]|uniref:S-type anion channel SLAH2 n=1 Tax=Apostasia shenzhenica TaxID=1088818 RepID=A0A2I0AFW1_9ASPA|nr:S-type anion channel SLAH2 [Apostasia shenzhenica]